MYTRTGPMSRLVPNLSPLTGLIKFLTTTTVVTRGCPHVLVLSVRFVVAFLFVLFLFLFLFSLFIMRSFTSFCSNLLLQSNCSRAPDAFLSVVCVSERVCHTRACEYLVCFAFVFCLLLIILFFCFVLFCF